MNEFFLSALAFGLAAGLKPGPLGVIVMQQALSRGLLAGVRASLAPLITDGPIIIVAVFLLTRLPQGFLNGIGIVGGLYLLVLAARLLTALLRGGDELE